MLDQLLEFGHAFVLDGLHQGNVLLHATDLHVLFHQLDQALTEIRGMKGGYNVLIYLDNNFAEQDLVGFLVIDGVDKSPLKIILEFVHEIEPGVHFPDSGLINFGRTLTFLKNLTTFFPFKNYILFCTEYWSIFTLYSWVILSFCWLMILFFSSLNCCIPCSRIWSAFSLASLRIAATIFLTLSLGSKSFILVKIFKCLRVFF